MEEERKNALEMGKEKKEKNKESAKDESRQALMLMLVVGLDLAGSAKRPTGFCLMNDKLECITKILHSDKEILKEIAEAKPVIVSIDAPLSLPRGRKGLGDVNGSKFRKCDIELRNLHIRFFPITLGPMRMLTKRGMSLKKRLERLGFRVAESYPGGAQDVLGMPRKQKGLALLRIALEKYGVRNLRKDASGDELDAATCAIVGIEVAKGNALMLGDASEGQIAMPGVTSKLQG
ncbi:MAG: DUF429 domain-containing protein [Candidatus Micrarchaeia archaeon]